MIEYLWLYFPASYLIMHFIIKVDDGALHKGNIGQLILAPVIVGMALCLLPFLPIICLIIWIYGLIPNDPNQKAQESHGNTSRNGEEVYIDASGGCYDSDCDQ